MRALVVHESMFGNTRRVAEAVAAGLRSRLEVVLASADEAPSILDGYDLVAVGGPTHAFGMSRASTRADAVERGATEPIGLGIREWVDVLAGTVPAAITFDTRVRRPRVPGSAARAVGRALRHHGATLLAPPTTFWVDDVEGPLLPGEEDRARQWGVQVAEQVEAASHGAPA